MLTTQLTLIQRASRNESGAWELLDELYRPFVTCWFSVHIQNLVDVDDLTQEVLTTVFRELPAFDHSGRTGAFRKWLRTICLNRLLGYRRQLQVRGGAVGGSEFAARLNEIPDESDLEKSWNLEHDAAVLRFLFQRIETTFEAQTISVFRRLVIDGVAVAEVAGEFSISIGAAYVARSRVLRKLREESEQYLGDSGELP
jgi:RNA polymerase sigma factor (sigma-70 family)